MESRIFSSYFSVLFVEFQRLMALAVKKYYILRKYTENICYICSINNVIMAKYIYKYSSWPTFTWDENIVHPLLSEVRFLQGQVLGKIQTLGFSVQEQTALSTITDDVIKSSEIEGELLNYDQVRSSVARRLGIETVGLVESDRYVEGVVEMMLDATQNYKALLDDERLFGWHNALFPTGRSGLYKIEVAQYRTGETQVVSGAMGKEVVHFQAPRQMLCHQKCSSF